MSFTFRIHFTGLCAVVPQMGQSFERGDMPEHAWMLMPNVMKPTEVREVDAASGAERSLGLVPTHLPFIDFFEDELTVGQPDLHYCRADEDCSRLRALKRLEHAEVTIHATKATGPGRALMSGVGAIGAVPEPGNERSLRWMMELSKLLGEPARLKPNLRLPLVDPDPDRAADPDALEQDLSTRWRIDDGNLSSHVREPTGTTPYLPFRFAQQPDKTYFIPHTVTLELTEVTQVDLRITPFETPGVYETLTFQADSGEIDIFSRHMELETHLGLVDREFEPVPDTGYNQDLDFSIYFRLLQNPPSRLHIPRLPAAFGRSAGSGPCRPTEIP